MNDRIKRNAASRNAANEGKLAQWLGRAVLELRAKQGSSQVDLARHIGVSRASVAFWELGVTPPSMNLLPRVASALGLSAGELVTYAQKQYEGAEPVGDGT